MNMRISFINCCDQRYSDIQIIVIIIERYTDTLCRFQNILNETSLFLVSGVLNMNVIHKYNWYEFPRSTYNVHMWYHQSRMICDMTANYEKKKISLNESSTDIIIEYRCILRQYFIDFFAIQHNFRLTNYLSLSIGKIVWLRVICNITPQINDI